uniref:Uncharacterized protein n=1 Tax=Arundo donax TaxID=35708 RepID=A0A0A9A0F4_ARUDO
MRWPPPISPRHCLLLLLVFLVGLSSIPDKNSKAEDSGPGTITSLRRGGGNPYKA